MIDYSAIDREFWTLSEEGQQVAEQGSHEARVFEAIPAGEEGISMDEIKVMKKVDKKEREGKIYANLISIYTKIM